MKRILTTLALALPLLASGGAFADDAKPLVLDAVQLDQVNAGLAFAFGSATAGAQGVFISFTDANTVTAAVSVLGPIPASGSFSGANSVSFAF